MNPGYIALLEAHRRVRVHPVYIALSWAITLALVVLALVLSGCGHGPACPRVINGGDAQRQPSPCKPPAAVHELVKLKYYVDRPCIREDPPRGLPMTGDPELDRARLAGNYNALRAWASLWTMVCTVNVLASVRQPW